MSRIVIIGGGPAGYEAALVAAQLDAEVTVVEAEGAGGACVLSTASRRRPSSPAPRWSPATGDTEEFGVHSDGLEAVTVDAAAVHERVKRLALAQSADIHAKLVKAGVDLRLRAGPAGRGHARPHPPGARHPGRRRRRRTRSTPSTVLIATGATPRVLPDAPCPTASAS